jgi:hypothetical protein
MAQIAEIAMVIFPVYTATSASWSSRIYPEKISFIASRVLVPSGEVRTYLTDLN